MRTESSNASCVAAMDRCGELPEVIFATSPHPLAPTCTGVGGEITDDMLHAGLKALLQCTSSDLEDFSATLMDRYEGEVRRVFDAMRAATLTKNSEATP